jgi:transposase
MAAPDASSRARRCRRPMWRTWRCFRSWRRSFAAERSFCRSTGIGVLATGAAPDDLSEFPDGTSLAAIAARYGVTLAVARRWITGEGLALTRRPGGRPRLFDAAEIVRLYAEGRTQTEVAAAVGCGLTTVSTYVREARVSSSTRLRPRPITDSGTRYFDPVD